MNRTLVVVVVVVLSGVGGATAFSTGTTDAAESTQTTDLPPGLTADGVADPLALADAHQATLRDTSYTISTTYEYRWPNGTLIGHGTTTSQVAPEGASFHTVTSQAYRNGTEPLGLEHAETATWSDGDRTLTARDLPGEPTEYRERSAASPGARPETGWGTLYTAFSAVNTTIASQVERNGTTLYRVVTTSQSELNSVYSGDSAYSAVAFVDSDGVVRTFQQTHPTTYDDRPAIVTRTIHVTNVGNTTVEEPSWTDRATENETLDRS